MNFFSTSIVIYLTALFTIVLQGCKTLQTETGITSPTLPEKFVTEQTLGENAASLPANVFFKDPVLKALIDTAIGNNPDMKAAWQRIEQAKTQIQYAKGLLFPQVNLSPNAAIRRYGLYTMDGAGNISTFIQPNKIVPINLPDYYLGLQASWEADIWGKLNNKRRSAVANWLAGKEAFHLLKTNLVADVAINYYTLAALDRQLQQIQQTILQQTEALEVVKTQKETGRATELVVLQFEAQLTESKVLETEVMQQIISHENALNVLLGRFSQPVIRSANALTDTTSFAIASGIPLQLIANRPDLRMAAKQAEATYFETKSAKAAFYPGLQINSSLGFQAFLPSLVFQLPTSLAYTLIGGITAPLLNMSRLKADFNFAKSGQAAALYNYNALLFKAVGEVNTEQKNFENLSTIVTLKKQQNQTLLRSADISLELYRNLRANYLEVLFARQNALKTNMELTNAMLLQKISLINLYRNLGGGWK